MATREKGGVIQMDLQGEACSRRKRGEVQGALRGKGVFIEGGLTMSKPLPLSLDILLFEPLSH